MRTFILKLLIGIAGLVALIKFGAIDPEVLTKVTEHPRDLALAFLCLLATVPIGAFRWWILLNGLRFNLSFSWSIGTTLVSLFFSTFLPGAYGGDLVRLALGYRAVGAKLNQLVSSLVVDRLSGAFALLLLGIAVLPALPVNYADRLVWICCIVIGASFAGAALVLFAGDVIAHLLRSLPAPVGPVLAHIAADVTAALRAYLHQPFLLLGTVALSIFQYALVLLAMIVLGHSMDFVSLPLSGYVIAGAWSLVANALPVTPGGIGFGEAAFAHAASALANASSAPGSSFGTVFLAMRLLTIAIGLIGLAPWLFTRAKLRSGLSAVKADSNAAKRAVPLAE